MKIHPHVRQAFGWWTLAAAVGTYVAVALAVYAFRNPEMTQRFFHFFDAMAWR